MKTVITLALAAAAVATAPSAFAKPAEQSFQRDGYTYVYSVTETEQGRQIRGKYFPGARPFALNVRNGRVAGTVNNSSVAFTVKEAANTANGTLASAN